MIKHELSYGLINDIYLAFSKNEHWLAYDTSLYYMERGHVLTFRDYEKAKAFVEAKISRDEAFTLIRPQSIADVFKQIPYEKNLFHLLNQHAMNEKNLEYLKDNLRYMGFGDKLFPQLQKELEKGAPDFQLRMETEMNKKPFAAVLNFRKSDNSELYFFNSYHASLQRSNGKVADQAFYLNKGKGVTAKEAYNLLEGRAVYKELENKEGQKYGAWLQLDFSKRDKHNNHEVKQYHNAYGFKLEDALQRFPIRELKEPDLKDILLQSLQKGNLQAVGFEREGNIQRMFVEADPKFKSVNIYDSNLKRVPGRDLELYHVKGHGEGIGQDAGKEISQKKEVVKSTPDEPGPAQNRAKTGKEKGPKDLLPQKEGQGNQKSIKVK
ncbi:MAG TPA: hypothetical protein VGN63_18845 [Flavisolibacter sp.]|jgi:hypothetical protein|nr:hypothetical protein [Flavisolibacter sp.]